MTADLCSAPSTPSKYPSPAANDMEGWVQLVLGRSQPSRKPERRRAKRHPFPYPILLRSVAEDGLTPADPPIVVLGKHLSHHGLDFYHREPVPDRRAVVTFEYACMAQPVSLLMELTWCRFDRFGFYENGGRFLRVCSSVPHVAGASGSARLVTVR